MHLFRRRSQQSSPVPPATSTTPASSSCLSGSTTKDSHGKVKTTTETSSSSSPSLEGRLSQSTEKQVDAKPTTTGSFTSDDISSLGFATTASSQPQSQLQQHQSEEESDGITSSNVESHFSYSTKSRCSDHTTEMLKFLDSSRNAQTSGQEPQQQQQQQQPNSFPVTLDQYDETNELASTTITTKDGPPTAASNNAGNSSVSSATSTTSSSQFYSCTSNLSSSLQQHTPSQHSRMQKNTPLHDDEAQMSFEVPDSISSLTSCTGPQHSRSVRQPSSDTTTVTVSSLRRELSSTKNNKPNSLRSFNPLLEDEEEDGDDDSYSSIDMSIDMSIDRNTSLDSNFSNSNTTISSLPTQPLLGPLSSDMSLKEERKSEQQKLCSVSETSNTSISTSGNRSMFSNKSHDASIRKSSHGTKEDFSHDGGESNDSITKQGHHSSLEVCSKETTATSSSQSNDRERRQSLTRGSLPLNFSTHSTADSLSSDAASVRHISPKRRRRKDRGTSRLLGKGGANTKKRQTSTHTHGTASTTSANTQSRRLPNAAASRLVIAKVAAMVAKGESGKRMQIENRRLTKDNEFLRNQMQENIKQLNNQAVLQEWLSGGVGELAIVTTELCKVMSKQRRLELQLATVRENLQSELTTTRQKLKRLESILLEKETQISELEEMVAFAELEQQLQNPGSSTPMEDVEDEKDKEGIEVSTSRRTLASEATASSVTLTYFPGFGFEDLDIDIETQTASSASSTETGTADAMIPRSWNRLDGESLTTAPSINSGSSAENDNTKAPLTPNSTNSKHSITSTLNELTADDSPITSALNELTADDSPITSTLNELTADDSPSSEKESPKFVTPKSVGRRSRRRRRRGSADSDGSAAWKRKELLLSFLESIANESSHSGSRSNSERSSPQLQTEEQLDDEAEKELQPQQFSTPVSIPRRGDGVSKPRCKSSWNSSETLNHCGSISDDASSVEQQDQRVMPPVSLHDIKSASQQTELPGNTYEASADQSLSTYVNRIDHASIQEQQQVTTPKSMIDDPSGSASQQANLLKSSFEEIVDNNHSASEISFDHSLLQQQTRREVTASESMIRDDSAPTPQDTKPSEFWVETADGNNYSAGEISIDHFSLQEQQNQEVMACTSNICGDDVILQEDKSTGPSMEKIVDSHHSANEISIDQEQQHHQTATSRPMASGGDCTLQEDKTSESSVEKIIDSYDSVNEISIDHSSLQGQEHEHEHGTDPTPIQSSDVGFDATSRENEAAESLVENVVGDNQSAFEIGIEETLCREQLHQQATVARSVNSSNSFEEIDHNQLATKLSIDQPSRQQEQHQQFKIPTSMKSSDTFDSTSRQTEFQDSFVEEIVENNHSASEISMDHSSLQEQEQQDHLDMALADAGDCTSMQTKSPESLMKEITDSNYSAREICANAFVQAQGDEEQLTSTSVMASDVESATPRRPKEVLKSPLETYGFHSTAGNGNDSSSELKHQQHQSAAPITANTSVRSKASPAPSLEMTDTSNHSDSGSTITSCSSHSQDTMMVDEAVQKVAFDFLLGNPNHTTDGGNDDSNSRIISSQSSLKSSIDSNPSESQTKSHSSLSQDQKDQELTKSASTKGGGRSTSKRKKLRKNSLKKSAESKHSGSTGTAKPSSSQDSTSKRKKLRKLKKIIESKTLENGSDVNQSSSKEKQNRDVEAPPPSRSSSVGTASKRKKLRKPSVDKNIDSKSLESGSIANESSSKTMSSVSGGSGTTSKRKKTRKKSVEKGVDKKSSSQEEQQQDTTTRSKRKKSRKPSSEESVDGKHTDSATQPSSKEQELKDAATVASSLSNSVRATSKRKKERKPSFDKSVDSKPSISSNQTSTKQQHQDVETPASSISGTDRSTSKRKKSRKLSVTMSVDSKQSDATAQTSSTSGGSGATSKRKKLRKPSLDKAIESKCSESSISGSTSKRKKSRKSTLEKIIKSKHSGTIAAPPTSSSTSGVEASDASVHSASERVANDGASTSRRKKSRKSSKKKSSSLDHSESGNSSVGGKSKTSIKLVLSRKPHLEPLVSSNDSASEITSDSLESQECQQHFKAAVPSTISTRPASPAPSLEMTDSSDHSGSRSSTSTYSSVRSREQERKTDDRVTVSKALDRALKNVAFDLPVLRLAQSIDYDSDNEKNYLPTSYAAMSSPAGASTFKGFQSPPTSNVVDDGASGKPKSRNALFDRYFQGKQKSGPTSA